MNKHFKIIYFLFLLFSLSIPILNAQNDFASEEEFKKQAAKLFNEEDFEKAYPLYSQLLSLYRKDPNYNFRLGVCMLFASDEKERAITFLEFATKNKDVEKESFFYLAKAYHLNYRFDEAIAQYQAYKKIASSAKIDRLQVDRQIEMCNNGKKLLRNLSDLPVIEKTEVGRDDFFRSYAVSEIGGKLLVKPDEKEFRTALDKKKNEKSILYLATNSSLIYFSSYGDNEQRGKDIFQMKKTPTGEWSKPQILSNAINTAYDEDYPFLHPNGKVMYFSSKGHNSMGGYDIFKSIFNETTNAWDPPINMDFPINTPDDDILYVSNADERKAFFASARSSVAGKIAVYHINVDRKPIDFIIIKGSVVKNRNAQNLNLKITIKNVSDNTIIGLFNAKANGAYEIKLPNAGSFLYTIESSDFATQSEIVNVPIQKEFKPLKQEISYELHTEKLFIKNMFEEANSDSNYILAINVIKEKSKLNVTPAMDVNLNEIAKQENIENKEIALSQQNNESSSEQLSKTGKTNTKLSNDDIIKIAYQDANVIDTEATTAREQADIAMSFANKKNELGQKKVQEAATLMAEAAKTDDNIKKQALTDEANAVNKEAEKLNEETVISFNLAKKIDATADAKREEANLAKQYAEGLEAAVNSKNSTEALVKLEELEKRLDALSISNADRFPVLNTYKKEEDYKKRELAAVIKLSGDLKQEISDNETIISDLKIEAEKTKKEQIKQGLNNQIAELVLENTAKQKEFEQNEIKTVKLQNDYNVIKKENELANTVVDQSKTSTSQTAAASVASVDEKKLELQVNSLKIKNEQNNIASNSLSSDNQITNVPSPNTTNKISKELIDIDKQYTAELSAIDNNTNENEREKEKAAIYKKWSEIIDDNILKLKENYISTPDSEMKAIIAKKINDAEISSKEKQDKAQQSIVKVENSNNVKPSPTLPLQNKSEETVSLNTINENTNNDDIANKDNKPNTSSKIYSDINKKYINELATVEKIENEKEREQEKSNVLQKWSEAINADVVKQKIDLEASSDSEMKAILTKKISDAENSSKEKQLQADQSMARVNSIKEPAANSPDRVIASSNSTKETSAAKTLDKQADTLEVYALELKVKANNQTNPDQKKLLLEQSNEILLQSKEKKIQSAQLNGKVNQIEYNNNKIQLDKLSKTYSNSNSDEISRADMLNDEAFIYYEKAKKLIKSADTTKSINEKEKLLKDANKNEFIAIEKQKKSAELFLNYNPSNANSEAVSSNNTIKQDETNKDVTKTNGLVDIAKESKLITDENTAESEIGNQQKQNTSITNGASKTTTENNIETAETGNEEVVSYKELIKKENTYVYTDSAANELYAKAKLLNDQADDLMAQSIVYQFETVDKTSNITKKERAKQGKLLVKRSQDKRILAAELFTNANKIEFDFNKNKIEELAKITSANNYPEISKADLLSDESTRYFEAGKVQRKKANKISDPYPKSEAFEAALDNEMMALEKQKESYDIYKKFNPNATTAFAATDKNNNKNDAAATNYKFPPNDNASAIEASKINFDPSTNNNANEKNLVYKEPGAKENKIKIDLLNKEAAEKLSLSLVLKAEAAKQKNIETKNTIYIQSEELTKEAQDKKIQAFQLMALTNLNEYKANQKNINQFLNKFSSNNESEFLKAELMNDEAIKYFDAAKKERMKADADESYPSKEKEFEAAAVNEIKALEKQRESLDIYQNYNPITASSAVKQNDNVSNNKTNSNLPTAKNVSSAVNNSSNSNPISEKENNKENETFNSKLNIELNENNKINEPLISSNDKDLFSKSEVKLATNEAFEQKTNNAYSVANPIPINEKIPDGIIFKVQIGAFRKPIPQDLFQGISPITGETTSKGFIRYTAGIFAKFTTAEKIKNKIINLGYKDAFIVAFYNGKRIPINDAYAMAVGVPSSVLKINDAGEKPFENVNQEMINKTINEPVVNQKTEDISSVDGLFYTVQVGVFSQPIMVGKLYNLKPLYTSVANNGYLRYYTGIYNSVSRATEATEMINDIGVKDAFVTAYYNGKRISIAEAKQIEKQGIAVFSKENNLNKLPVFSKGSDQISNGSNTNQPINNNLQNSTNGVAIQKSKNTNDINEQSTNASGIIFKVQIGAFYEEVPIDIANKFFKIATKGIKNYIENDGLTIYTVGNLDTYEEAVLLKAEVAAAEITGSFVVAFRNNQKISIEEARAIK